jgi:PDZ domain-containing secreted protein
VLIQSLKKQLEAKDNVLKTNNETRKQLQTAIDVLAKAEETNNRTIQELREKEKKHQATIDDLTKTV